VSNISLIAIYSCILQQPAGMALMYFPPAAQLLGAFFPVNNEYNCFGGWCGRGWWLISTIAAALPFKSRRNNAYSLHYLQVYMFATHRLYLFIQTTDLPLTLVPSQNGERSKRWQLTKKNDSHNGDTSFGAKSKWRQQWIRNGDKQLLSVCSKKLHTNNRPIQCVQLQKCKS